MTQIAQNINISFGLVNSILDKKLVTKISRIEKRIFYVAVFLFIFVSIFYAYFVNQTIRNVAKRENIEIIETGLLINKKILIIGSASFLIIIVLIFMLQLSLLVDPRDFI